MKNIFLFMLTPVPVKVAEASDSMAVDLWRATLFVLLPLAQANNAASHQAGLLVLTGTLSVGNREQGDGRICVARLQLDAAPEHQASASR